MLHFSVCLYSKSFWENCLYWLSPLPYLSLTPFWLPSRNLSLHWNSFSQGHRWPPCYWILLIFLNLLILLLTLDIADQSLFKMLLLAFMAPFSQSPFLTPPLLFPKCWVAPGLSSRLSPCTPGYWALELWAVWNEICCEDEIHSEFQRLGILYSCLYQDLSNFIWIHIEIIFRIYWVI